MEDALGRADAWWDGHEVTQVQPEAAAMSFFLNWMRIFKLGRKRLLDTMLAATYKANGVSLVLSSNWRDFALFPGVHPVAIETAVSRAKSRSGMDCPTALLVQTSRVEHQGS